MDKTGSVDKIILHLAKFPLDHWMQDVYIGLAPTGRVAEWLCRGLQILVRRFNSGPGLQTSGAKKQHH